MRIKKPPPPANLAITVLDAAGQALPRTAVGAGDRYLTTDSSGTAFNRGTVYLFRNRPGNKYTVPFGVEIRARAPGHLRYERLHKLSSGENTLTIHLQALTAPIKPIKATAAPKAYLTIDDGPSPRWTPKVLDILEKEGVPATFFMVGRRVRDHPELVRLVYLDGHELGNHTFSHDYRRLYQGGGIRDYLASLAENGRAIKDILGFEPRITRPPGGPAGNFEPGWQTAVNRAGYTTVLWNVSTGDGATETTSRQMVENAKRYLDRLPPGEAAVILMHDVRRPIVKALPGIIAEVRKRGYEFSVVTPDLRKRDIFIGSTVFRRS